jgi:hypothetical protein
MRDTDRSRTTMQRALATPRTSPPVEQTGQMAQAFKRAAADHAHIAQRAYELYEQRGRQDGWGLEDWLKAERELGGAVHHA